MHPTRRQIFAGKPYSPFPNIWEWLISVNGAQSSEALGPQPPNLLSTESKHLGRITWHMEKPVLPEQKCNIGCTVIICYGSVFLQIFRLKNDQTPLVGLATKLHLASSSGETGSHLQSCNHQNLHFSFGSKWNHLQYTLLIISESDCHTNSYVYIWETLATGHA